MKKKVFIIVPILIVVIIGIVLAFLYFTTDLFKPVNNLFWKYFAQNEDVFTVLANDRYEEQTQFKQNNSYTSNGNLSFQLQQGEDSFKQLNVLTTSRHDVNTGRTYADAILKNGDIDLFQVSYINSNDIYAIKCEEVFANYVGIQNSGLKQLATNYGLNYAQNIPDSIDFNGYADLLDITDEQKQHIIDTYLPIITNNIEENQYEKAEEQIEIEGTSYNTNMYRLQLTGENFKQILINVLNTLKSDTETLIIISNKLSTLGFGIDYTDVTNLTTRIDELINQIEQIDIVDNISISVYESDTQTIRTVIEIENKFNITYDRANNVLLTIDIAQSYDYNTIGTNEYESNNQIIDLNSINNNTSESMMRILISKNKTDSITSNNIQIIPDTNNTEQNINIEYSMSNVSNNNINNSYIITISNFNNQNKEVITINYDTNISRADQVEEIQELTNSNTAIANNYGAEEFTTFINSWSTIFFQKLEEKMAVLGFENNF